jgi:uncharacterized cupredoxin-like copper-binding protein
MTKVSSLRGRLAVLLATFAVFGMAAAYAALRASADGRTLVGNFCPGFCMSITSDGVVYGTPNRADLALRPGTYWLTVNDNSTHHNFTLRSCPDATSACDQTSGGTVDPITTAAFTGTVTQKVLLTHGTYRLYCSVDGHEGMGMYVDFEVGGVGQVG